MTELARLGFPSRANFFMILTSSTIRRKGAPVVGSSRVTTYLEAISWGHCQ